MCLCLSNGIVSINPIYECPNSELPNMSKSQRVLHFSHSIHRYPYPNTILPRTNYGYGYYIYFIYYMCLCLYGEIVSINHVNECPNSELPHQRDSQEQIVILYWIRHLSMLGILYYSLGGDWNGVLPTGNGRTHNDFLRCEVYIVLPPCPSRCSNLRYSKDTIPTIGNNGRMLV